MKIRIPSYLKAYTLYLAGYSIKNVYLDSINIVTYLLIQDNVWQHIN